MPTRGRGHDEGAWPIPHVQKRGRGHTELQPNRRRGTEGGGRGLWGGGQSEEGGRGRTSCSRLLYSPSVFSLTMRMSMSRCRVSTLGRLWQWMTLA